MRRETELGALLHDIGKIHIPDAIINKPGKLDADEWAMMKTHTIEGQQMLDRVGGLLVERRPRRARVARALRRRRLPRRPRRRGHPARRADRRRLRLLQRDDHDALLPQGDAGVDAVDELRRCSGTQFDPDVVDALLAVVGDPGWQLALHAPVKTDAAKVYSSAP